MLLIFRFVDKVQGDDPVPTEEIPPPEEKASEQLTRRAQEGNEERDE